MTRASPNDRASPPAADRCGALCAARASGRRRHGEGVSGDGSRRGPVLRASRGGASPTTKLTNMVTQYVSEQQRFGDELNDMATEAVASVAAVARTLDIDGSGYELLPLHCLIDDGQCVGGSRRDRGWTRKRARCASRAAVAGTCGEFVARRRCPGSAALSAASRTKWLEAWPLEHELTAHRQSSPQRSQPIQSSDDALHARRVLCSLHEERAQCIGSLPGFAAPGDVAQRGDALGHRHLRCRSATARPKRLFALQLLALLAHALSRADVAFCGRDERACASSGAPVNTVHEAQLGLDDVVDQIMRDVIVVSGCRIGCMRGTTGDTDEDGIAPLSRAFE
jgi:hypothetical protein